MKCARRVARELQRRKNLAARLLAAPAPKPKRAKTDIRPLAALDVLNATEAVLKKRLPDTS